VPQRSLEGMEQHHSSLTATRVTLLNLATVGAFVAWAVFASWGIAYLMSH
jgi:hypothetical protein